MANQPVVWTGVEPGPDQLVEAGGRLVRQPEPMERVPAADGPAGWERVPAGDTKPTVVPEPTTVVSDVSQTDSSVSFHVDRVGTPVEVKVSYFPNWQANGAQGPWRVAPNLMVVVPTSHDVTLALRQFGGRQGRRADLAGRPGRGHRWPSRLADRRARRARRSVPATCIPVP